MRQWSSTLDASNDLLDRILRPSPHRVSVSSTCCENTPVIFSLDVSWALPDRILRPSLHRASPSHARCRNAPVVFSPDASTDLFNRILQRFPQYTLLPPLPMGACCRNALLTTQLTLVFNVYLLDKYKSSKHVGFWNETTSQFSSILSLKCVCYIYCTNIHVPVDPRNLIQLSQQHLFVKHVRYATKWISPLKELDHQEVDYEWRRMTGNYKLRRSFQNSDEEKSNNITWRRNNCSIGLRTCKTGDHNNTLRNWTSKSCSVCGELREVNEGLEGSRNCESNVLRCQRGHSKLKDLHD